MCTEDQCWAYHCVGYVFMNLTLKIGFVIFCQTFRLKKMQAQITKIEVYLKEKLYCFWDLKLEQFKRKCEERIPLFPKIYNMYFKFPVNKNLFQCVGGTYNL